MKIYYSNIRKDGRRWAVDIAEGANTSIGCAI